MRMRRIHLALAAMLSLLGGATVAAAQGAPLTKADSALAVFRRAQRMVNDGQGAEGRALVDSMMNAAEPGTPGEAEALFWRATLAESWASAQRDYLRIMLEHDRSPRAGDAMLRLAQGEYARGDREAALRYLDRLAREAPDAPVRAEAGLWQGRLLVEGSDRDNGCRVLRETRSAVKPGSLELENQYDYLLRGCPDPVAVATEPAPTSAAPAPATPTATPAATATNAPPSTPAPVRAAPNGAATTPTTSRSPASPTASRTSTMWSVQVGAYSGRTEADGAVTKLRARGYDARVDGSAAPWRVRFGLFPTRAAAVEALERYKSRDKGTGFLVEVPRG